MRLLQSTTVRFAALVFVLQLAGALVLLAAVHQLTRAELSAASRDLSEEMRDDLLAAYSQGGVADLGETIRARVASGNDPGSVILLVGRDSLFLAGNIAFWPPNVPAATHWRTIELFRIGRPLPERMGVIATQLPGGNRLLTGHVIESELRFAGMMEGAMLSTLLLAVALAALAAWYAARMIERRLDATVHTVRAVAAGDLERRVPFDRSDDAFEALAVEINAMLDRIAALMAELKVVTDGLAHDLRSPLTRLRATLDRGLAQIERGDGAAAIGRAIDEADTLLGMLNTALQISRAEAGLGREVFVTTDLGTMLEDIAEVFGPLAEERGFALAVEAEPAVRAPVHRELLAQALANLVDNALKYGSGRILLTANHAVGGVVLSVTDEGPGIAAGQRSEALRRFGRLDAARGDSGAGLGLALVSAVARLHGGWLSLGDNHPHGLRVELMISDGCNGRPLR